ncbi:Nucleolin [Dactylella cylindrospora]|nr:Nucleolin [Dactylella cylindrospora]
MPDEKVPSRIAFVGNIPYGLSEEQITDIFSKVGQVHSFRLVYDRDTGKPKGFGFVEYADAEIAASAVRNLDNFEIMGRKLRVDFSHEGDKDAHDGYEPPAAGTSSRGNPNAGTSSNTGPSSGSSLLPPLPPGIEVPPNLEAPDVISKTLEALPPAQLLDIISQMKQLATQEPAKCLELLRKAPQLCYAIFQALLLMNLVDPSILSQVIESSGAPAATAPPAPPQQPAPPPQQSYGQYQPTPAPAAQPAKPPIDPQKAQLIQQVMSLTQDQIMSLPPEQQAAILQLRQQIMSGNI